MIRSKYNIFHCITFILFLFTGSISFAQNKEKNILIIHSYHQGLEWTDSISAGILSVFKPHPEFNLHFEYLDTKRNSSPDYFNSLIELHRLQTNKIKYEAIIVSDNAAYEFTKNYKQDFFPEIPVFYCGVNFLNRKELEQLPDFFGYAEKANHLKTLEMVKELFPKRKNVLIINDNTLTGEKIRNELEEVLTELKSDFNFEFINTFSIDELKNRVNKLDDDYVIYLLVLNKDRLGNYISYNHGINIIRANTNVPIFGSWDFYLNKGLIGGNIIRAKEQGKQVSILAYNYLKKIDTSPEPYQTCPTTPTLDYNQLVQYNLEKHNLVQKSEVINAPIKLLEQTKLLIKIVIALTTALITSLIFLILRKLQKVKLTKLVDLKTKELQKANIKLAEINQSKNEILGIVAHDLRSPIGTISGFCDYILTYEEETKKLSDKAKKIFTTIEQTSVYMLNLVSDLLNHSAIESGKLQIELVKSNYVEFVQRVIENNNTHASKKNIELKLNCNENLVGLAIDGKKIKQVLNNLISNAIRFSKPDSSIIIEIIPSTTSVTTSVIDYGSGISEKDQKVIFDKFKSLNTEENYEHKGSGLGLSIAKGIIEAHKGTLSVESKINKGSKFSFDLPLIPLCI